MGRYPLMTVVNKYLEERSIVVQPSTLDNESRILRHIAREIQSLVDDGVMSTANPTKMVASDIKFYSDHLTGKVNQDTKRKYLQYLNGLLLFAENPIMEKMKRKGFRVPRASRKPIRSLSDGELSAIQGAALEMEGWKGARAAFLANWPALMSAAGIGAQACSPRGSKHKDLAAMDTPPQGRRLLGRAPHRPGHAAVPP